MFERLREVWRRSSTAGEAYPAELAFMLRNPLRRLILSPRGMVRRLDPAPTDRVLEVGPGPGYFSLELAQAVPRGMLLLMDLQPAMLAKARTRLSRARARNVRYQAADARALPYAEASIDLALLVAVLGEVPDKKAALAELYRVVRPGGRLNLTEQPGDADFISLAEITALAEQAGFQATRHWGGRSNYSAEFRRP